MMNLERKAELLLIFKNLFACHFQIIILFCSLLKQDGRHCCRCADIRSAAGYGFCSGTCSGLWYNHAWTVSGEMEVRYHPRMSCRRSADLPCSYILNQRWRNTVTLHTGPHRWTEQTHSPLRYKWEIEEKKREIERRERVLWWTTGWIRNNTKQCLLWCMFSAGHWLFRFLLFNYLAALWFKIGTVEQRNR